MKLTKITKVVMPLLLAAGLAACGGETKPLNQQIVQSVSNIGSLVMNGSTGSAYPDRSVGYNINYGENIFVTLSVKKNYTTTDSTGAQVNEVANVTITYKMDDASTAKWKYQGFVRDTSGTLLSDKGQYSVIDQGENTVNFTSTLTATISWDGYSEDFSWTINVKFQEYTPISLEAFRVNGGVSSGGYIKTAGYITGKFSDTYAGVFIASGEKAVMLYAGNLEALMTSTSAQIGDLVVVKGQYSPYNGLAEIKPATMQVVESAPSGLTVNTPVDLTIAASGWSTAALASNDSRITNMNDLTLVSVPTLTVGSHWTIVFKTSTNVTVNVYVNYHVGSDVQNAIKNLLSSATAGTSVFNFVGGILSWYNAPQLSPLSASNLVLLS